MAGLRGLIAKPARPYFVSVKPNMSSTGADDLRLLHVDIDTMFVMSGSGRIERVNDPDRSTAPRVFLVGCPFGNLARVRYDVDDRIAARVLEAAAKEPPWRDPDVTPRCVREIAAILPDASPAAEPYPIYQLPSDLSYEHPSAIVRGDSAEGREMLARLADLGMPDYMRDAGFEAPRDLWEPWCVALDGADITAMAFAARLGETGAEIGVYTFPKYRGHGLAAAVTASWSSMSSLSHRALFYSTSKSNLSSQRVAARLGLRQIGASISIK